MNPELRRNIWIELTPQRLVIPLVIFFLVWWTMTTSAATLFHTPGRTLFFGLFIGIAVVWGLKLTGEAVPSEIRDYTWDNQRMSSIGAWSMTWGKLVGATIYAWYVAFISLGFYFFGYPTDTLVRDLKVVASIIAIAVFIHCLAMIASLEASPVHGRRGGIFDTFIMIGVLIVISSFGVKAAELFEHEFRWYEQTFHGEDFLLSSFFVFAAWAVLGAYRTMRVELQYRNSPAVWVLFLAFLSFYYNGFSTAGYDALEKLSIHVDSNKRFQVFLLLFFFISISSAWLTLIAERKDLVRLRKAYGRAFTSGRRLSALTLVPKWLVSACLAVVLLGAMIATNLSFGPLEGALEYNSTLVAGALLLFFTRDAFIVLLCHSGGRFKARANMAALIYLFCLYSVLPWFLQVSGMRSKLHWAYPFVVTQPVDLLAAVFQIAVAVALYSARLRDIRNEVDGSPSIRG